MSNFHKARKTAYNKWISSKKSPFDKTPESITPLDFSQSVIEHSQNPVIEALLERRKDPKSIPNKRSDDYKISLGIEGGG